MPVAVKSVASAFPETSFSQEEIAKLLGVKNPVVLKLLAASHIQRRSLLLGTPAADGCLPMESQAQLHRRFLSGIRGFGMEAARKALLQAQVDPQQVAVIVTVTSSGMALPGISAMAMQELGINRKAHRIDIGGMGCNAGMSGLRTLNQYLASMPQGTFGMLLCCEVNSAICLRDETVGAGIVNSLFGDGAAALIACSEEAKQALDPFNIAGPLDNKSFGGAVLEAGSLGLRLLDFETHTFLDYFDDMRYEVDEAQGLYNFKLSKRIPHAVAIAVQDPVKELLQRHKLLPSDVKHWIVHSGGAAVIEGVTRGLGLREDALRHTVSVLHDFGNIASGSFLVSFERLLAEHAANPGNDVISQGDMAVLIAMGPGTTVEVGLAMFQ